MLSIHVVKPREAWLKCDSRNRTMRSEQAALLRTVHGIDSLACSVGIVVAVTINEVFMLWLPDSQSIRLSPSRSSITIDLGR